VTDNTPLRSGKGSLYEGGIRVPLIVRWPGVTTAATVSHEPVMLMDLFPTLLGAAGITLPAGVPCDGTDIAPLLKNPESHIQRDAVFFHYPHYYETTTPVSAVRMGDWKLLEYFEDNHVELYNLKDDLSERTDLAKQQPDKTAALLARLHAWRDEVGAALPTPNPDFKGKK
jgi:arylsulfatase A-like enzyme